MAVIHHTSSAACPREVAFAFVDDYRNVPEWMFGVKRFDPITEQTSGLGTRFDAAMQIGPKTFTTTLEITEWIENELIVLTSIKGFETGSRWHFADTDDGGTELKVEFAYQLPGGLAGRALGAIIEPVVGQAVRHTDSTLKHKVEALSGA